MPLRSEQSKLFGRSREEQVLAEEGGERTLLRTSLVSSVGIRPIGPSDALRGANNRAHRHHNLSHSQNSNDRSLNNRAHHRDLTHHRETVGDWARGPGLSPITDASGDRGRNRTKGQP